MSEPSRTDAADLILGEFPRTLDERFRVAVPTELVAALHAVDGACVLAKQRPGCLSLWEAAAWRKQMDAGVELIRAKMRAGKLEGRSSQVQMLGRLLSTRHADVQLGDRGRLLIPDGFRPFLQAEAGGEVVLVGAGICIEIWKPESWLDYLNRRIPRFKKLFDRLSD
ncbi:MAG: division/cell wall cluster transcriptional repressor MraZ [Pirellula sp.]|nr:division/cell wall cluster transcriptional repressor MraZ [Pirellula sp.]